MEGMKEYPDNYFELAIVDPPYGINVGSAPGGGNKTYIPFGGFKSVERTLLGEEKIKKKKYDSSGGDSIAHPKSIRHSMIPTHRVPITSTN